MRLGQLARQLDKSPKEIHSFIEKRLGVEMKSHPNSKVPDELVEKIEKKFKVVEAEPEVIVVKEAVSEVIENVEDKPETSAEVESTIPPEKIEYEVPTLEGPKVVGKIELSESDLNREPSKKKERPDRPKRVREKPKRERKSGRKVKVETLEEKNRRESKELEAKRKASAETLKELKRKQYLEKTKNDLPKPNAKKKKKTCDIIREINLEICVYL